MKQLYSLLFIFLLYCFSFAQNGKLVFEYDKSGNQTLRKYETQSRFLVQKTLSESVTSAKKETYIYPNPVDRELTISWNTSISNLLTRIELVPYNGTNIENVKFTSSEGKAVLDMSYRPSGVYYIKIYVSDGRVLNHSIIKN